MSKLSKELTDYLDQLKDVPTSALVDVLCCRTTFAQGPDASVFFRRAITDFDKVSELVAAPPGVWTFEAALGMLKGFVHGRQNSIQVWRFEDAPKKLQALSTSGGSWIVVIPVRMKGDFIPWLEQGAFVGCAVYRYPLPDGREVRIGCHG